MRSLIVLFPSKMPKVFYIPSLVGFDSTISMESISIVQLGHVILKYPPPSSCFSAEKFHVLNNSMNSILNHMYRSNAPLEN